MESIENDTNFFNLSLLVEIIGCLRTTRKLSARIRNLLGISSQQCGSHGIYQSQPMTSVGCTKPPPTTYYCITPSASTSYYRTPSVPTSQMNLEALSSKKHIPIKLPHWSDSNDYNEPLTKNKHLFRLLLFVYILR